jgi:integrase
MPRKTIPPRIEEREGFYYVIHSESGRSRRTSLRTDDFYIAQQRFQGWLAEHAKFQNTRTQLVFSKCTELYLKQHAHKAASPQSLYSLCKILNRHFGDFVLTEITAPDIQTYVKERLVGIKIELADGGKETLSPVKSGTLRKELTIMRAVFNFMAKRVEPKELRVDIRDLAFVELPPAGAPRDRVFSDDEIAKIRRLIKPPSPPAKMTRLQIYLHLLIETGARSTAVRELEWSQVDLENGFIRLNPFGRQQTNKRRPIVPISDELAPILKRAKEESSSAYVCITNGDLRKTFERFMKRHQFKGTSAHTFRHTFATRLAQAGVSLVEISQLLGDQLTTVEKNYLHLQPSFLRRAINSLSTARMSATDR